MDVLILNQDIDIETLIKTLSVKRISILLNLNTIHPSEIISPCHFYLSQFLINRQI